MNYIVALAWVVARLREPSTYAGLAGLLLSYHVPHATELEPYLASIVISIASIIAIFLPEGPNGR